MAVEHKTSPRIKKKRPPAGSKSKMKTESSNDENLGFDGTLSPLRVLAESKPLVENFNKVPKKIQNYPKLKP